MKRDPEEEATCGLSKEEGAPALQVVSSANLDDEWFVVLAARPKAIKDYQAREIARAKDLMAQ